MASEVEETLKRLVAHRGVIGTMVINADGIPIKSTLDSHTTTQYAGLINQLVDQAKAMFREIDPSNDLSFIRLRTKKHEIMVAPDRDYLLLVIQNTQEGLAKVQTEVAAAIVVSAPSQPVRRSSPRGVSSSSSAMDIAASWYIAAAAVAVILLLSVLTSSVRPNNFPPGPLCLPLVGYIPFLDVRNLGRSFRKLSHKYGDIFSIFLGSRPVVVLNSWPLIKEAFAMKEFSGRPNIFSGTFFQKGKTGISTTEGQIWQEQRTFFHDYLKNLVHGTGATGFEELLMDEIQDMKLSLTKKVGEPLAPSYIMSVGIIDTLWMISSGRRPHSQQQEFQSVYECIDKITQFMSRAAIMSFMPFLATLVPESISKMERGRYYRDRFVAISEKWIREHQEEYRGNRAGDLQDAYLARMKEGTASFDTKGLGALLREMFVIGAESELVLLRWSFRILSVYKEVQQTMQQEIDQVVGRDGDVTWQHRHQLPFTRAALAEIQRFADITPSGGAGHKVLSDIHFHGYFLPKGTGVIANFNACHRDTKYWHHPDQFYPQHFLRDDGSFIENKEGFIPYGFGMRRCPAEHLSEMMTFLVMTNLLKAFHLCTPPDDDGQIGTQYEAGTGFIRNPRPFYVVLQSRP